MELWNHQSRSIKATLEAFGRGVRRVLLTIPTGGGKSRVAQTLIQHYAETYQRSILYTNRKLLTEQTGKVLDRAGITYGVRASGHKDNRERMVQIASIQTEHARVTKNKTWEIANAQLVIPDEAHQFKGEMACGILQQHYEAGSHICGLTATPLDLDGMYDELIIGATNSELRACNALQWCHHYGPDEPDLKHIKKVQVGVDLTERDNVKAIMVPGIFGRVLENWLKYNPNQLPSILFAPGVKESLWFAKQFEAAGIPAAHIDGDEVYVNGQYFKSSPDVRQQVLDASKDGSIKVVCNRYVLREGVDMPWLYCGIMATVLGNIKTYLQSVGRLLRYWPEYENKILIDHGGNWHRHGSVNADREWTLGLTSRGYSQAREETMRRKRCAKCGKPLNGAKCPCGEVNPVEPFCCPECKRVLNRPHCPCGWESPCDTRTRIVVQADGSLKEYAGDIYQPRKLSHSPDAADWWARCFWSARKKGRSFLQAMNAFNYHHGAYPAPNLPFMPKNPIDLSRKVIDVPFDRLYPWPETTQRASQSSLPMEYAR